LVDETITTQYASRDDTSLRTAGYTAEDSNKS